MPLPATFTPVHSLLGGLMLASSVTALLTHTGTVLGISAFFHASVRTLLGTPPRKAVTPASPGAAAAAAATGSGSGHRANGHDRQRRSDDTARTTAHYFTAGLLSAGVLLAAGRRVFEDKLGIRLFDDALPPPPVVKAGGQAAFSSLLLTLLLGACIPGLLVGAGTKLGSGCTSGHFLCGLSRLSPRSVAATATFFSVAVLTNLAHPLAAWLPYHGQLAKGQAMTTETPAQPDALVVLALQIPALVYGLLVPYVFARRARPADSAPETLKKQEHKHKQGARLTSFSAGVHFGLGLALSGMLRPSKVTGFLNLSPTHWANATWDPSLAMVALGGILPSSLAYFVFVLPKVDAQRAALLQDARADGEEEGDRKGERSTVESTPPRDAASPQQQQSTTTSTTSAPLLHTAAPLWRIPRSTWSSLAGTRIDAPLVLGATLFGLGWGVSGLCPGPGLVVLGGAGAGAGANAGQGEGAGAAEWTSSWRGWAEAQPGTAGSALSTALFTLAMALGGLLVG